MITKITLDPSNRLIQKPDEPLAQCLWLELFNPSQEERESIEKEFKLSLPQHHEMHQLEFSNRFYQEDGNYYLSLNVTIKALPIPENHVVTFVVTPSKLITLRYSDPNPLKTFIDQLTLRPQYVKNQIELLQLLLEICVGRAADIFELLDEKTEELSLTLTTTIDQTVSVKRSEILSNALKEINSLDNLLSKGRQSLASLNLFMVYLAQINYDFLKNDVNQIRVLNQDIKALLEHGNYLTQKLDFLLQSSLGLINIEQTHIIKTFTVLAMIFMPPTLIASIYGMNFKFMPELNFLLGYPYALFLMLISAYLPYKYFRKKRWI